MLTDAHGRTIDYLRLAVTDRCNLRCLYCMPATGIDFVPKSHLLTYEEMERLCRIFVGLGIRKVRITGGEPFVRRNMIGFLGRLSNITGIESLNLTTNGILTGPHLGDLKAMGISGINVSLDTLDEARFLQLTRRRGLETVLETIYGAIEHGLSVKVNMVVMGGRNHIDVLPMSELAQSLPIQVRFIEEMPFNGSGERVAEQPWSANDILRALERMYPELQRQVVRTGQTAQTINVPGFKGTLGVIAAYSRSFCGQCNRARVTPEGRLKTCLYEEGALDLRGLLRSSADDGEVGDAIEEAFRHKAVDGFEAERRRRSTLPIVESMAQIGG